MKLDFSVLTQPMQERGEHVGHPQSMLVPASPELSPAFDTGDKTPCLDGNTSIRPPLSPECRLLQGTPRPNVPEVVPPVPFVPPHNEQVRVNAKEYRSDVAADISQWMTARCVRRRDTWGSEKSLWRDYVGWCQQQKQFHCPCELFVATLDQSFRREMDGWQGIALAIDVAANPYVM
jgi:hypothetical protein